MREVQKKSIDEQNKKTRLYFCLKLKFVIGSFLVVVFFMLCYGIVEYTLFML